MCRVFLAEVMNGKSIFDAIVYEYHLFAFYLWEEKLAITFHVVLFPLLALVHQSSRNCVTVDMWAGSCLGIVVILEVDWNLQKNEETTKIVKERAANEKKDNPSLPLPRNLERVRLPRRNCPPEFAAFNRTAWPDLNFGCTRLTIPSALKFFSSIKLKPNKDGLGR